MAIEGEADDVARDASRHTDPVEIVQRCAHRGLTLATGESLTAGSLAARIADVPGTSAVLLGGVVAYSVTVKTQTLNVPEDLLESRGAVDPDVAAWMARGAATRCAADIGISTTGVAGPEPHQGKDVGTVYLGLACTAEAAQRLGLSLPEKTQPSDVDGDWLAGSLLLDLDGDRSEIRAATVEGALSLLEDFLHTEPPGLPPEAASG
ncbi:CinA family protein [Nesterenkonia alba]|uniref:CinA family protein n=1 Tax=Nesterenkonia alba TaxID=515814 RepID=UPI0003B74B4C|nr:CinA family protein [Nesterenkonia alba]